MCVCVRGECVCVRGEEGGECVGGEEGGECVWEGGEKYDSGS